MNRNAFLGNNNVFLVEFAILVGFFVSSGDFGGILVVSVIGSTDFSYFSNIVCLRQFWRIHVMNWVNLWNMGYT